MKLIEVKEVDEKLLQEIVKRIVSKINPKKIILFGSWAHGKPHKDSDLDILVIVEKLSTNSRREERIKIRALLQDILISQDIIVATVEDIEEWKNVPQAFITSIIKKGKVIYER
jgi:predicted nucleotidyltransferase